MRRMSCLPDNAQFTVYEPPGRFAVVPVTVPFASKKLPAPKPVLVSSATSPLGVPVPLGAGATVTFKFAVAPCVIVSGVGVIESVVTLPLDPVAPPHALTRLAALTVPRPVARSYAVVVA